jgi:hypothetical protein
MKLFITLFLIVINCQVKSQTPNVILGGKEINNVSYYVYDPPFLAKPIFNQLEDVKNNYPEKLMESIISASDQNWVNYNNLNISEIKDNAFFEKVKKQDKDKNYFELLSKLEFEANNSQMTIIKFNLYIDEKKDSLPLVGTYVCQKVDGIWKRVSTPFTTRLAMVMLVFKQDILKRLLVGKYNNTTEESLVKRILQAL